MGARATWQPSRARRATALTLSGLLGVFYVGLVATPAFADATCAVSGNDLFVALATGDAITISIIAGPELEIEPADASCDGHNPTAFDLIDVDGSTGIESVTISQGGAGGSFGSAIDFAIGLGASGGDGLVIDGSGAADAIGFGTAGASFDGASSVDVVFNGIERFTVNGLGGADVLSAFGGGALGDPFGMPITLSGSPDGDVITGGAAADTLDGGDGDDVLIGRTGNDTVRGAGGADEVNGGDDDDTVNGGDGDDVVDGGDDPDEVRGGAGDDVVTGGEGADEVGGGAGDDLIRGGKGDDEPSGGDGDDDVRGGPNNDELDGGKGSDVCVGGAGADSIVGCERGSP